MTSSYFGYEATIRRTHDLRALTTLVFRLAAKSFHRPRDEQPTIDSIALDAYTRPRFRGVRVGLRHFVLITCGEVAVFFFLLFMFFFYCLSSVLCIVSFREHECDVIKFFETTDGSNETTTPVHIRSGGRERSRLSVT